jgi:FAD:protein FMN transferase
MPRTLSRRQLVTFDFAAPVPSSSQWLRIHRTAMACRFEIVLSAEQTQHLPAARRALDEADRIEAALTVFRETSDVMRVNRVAAIGPVATSAELFALVTVCRDLSIHTGGAFDITSTPLSRCWGFMRREGRLPEPDEMASARALVGMRLVQLDPEDRTVQFARDGVELNFGSIGKGYALGSMGRILTAAGVDAALLSAAGSSVLAIGGPDGGWTIDLKSPQIARDRLCRIRLRDTALATSGAGEQFVTIDGTRHGHVIDPRTGWPARGVLSVSVAADDPAVADALSTAFLVGGPVLAERYCASHPETLVLLTPDDGSERPRVFGSHRGVAVEDFRDPERVALQ